MAIEDLSTATPAEIDSERYELYRRESLLQNKLEMCRLDMHRTAGDKGQYVGQSGRKVTTWKWERVLETLIQMAHCEGYPDRDAQRALGYWVQITTKLKTVQAETDVLTDEFDRRGGWTQAFLVQGNDGHVHSSMGCSTCNRGEFLTQFAWMTDYSGKTEQEIVEDAGERACTVCYSSAPTETLSRPTKMFGPDEIEAQKARDEREAKAAEKVAKKAKNAITDVDGGILYENAPTAKYRGHKILTLTAAKSRITDNIQYRDWGWNHQDDYARDIPYLAAAIAAKEGKTVEQVIAEAEKRAKNRK